METRRSKRKEAAACESLPPEPRSKRARRAVADSKARASTSTRAKAEAQSAGASGILNPSTVQAPKPAVPTTSESAQAPAERAEASTSQPELAEARKSGTSLEQQMGARKDLAEAQERAAMEQVRCIVTCESCKRNKFAPVNVSGRFVAGEESS